MSLTDLTGDYSDDEVVCLGITRQMQLISPDGDSESYHEAKRPGPMMTSR